MSGDWFDPTPRETPDWLPQIGVHQEDKSDETLKGELLLEIIEKHYDKIQEVIKFYDDRQFLIYNLAHLGSTEDVHLYLIKAACSVAHQAFELFPELRG